MLRFRLLSAFTLAATFIGTPPDAVAQSPPLRLIAAANVTVRQAPSADAPAVVRLPLGTEVTEAGDNDLEKTWTHIVMPDGRDGWVTASLTRRLDRFWKWQTQEQLIIERLARKGDGFPACVELLDFIERIANSFTEPDARARMDLHRLRALQQTLAAIPFGGATREPYAAWLTRYRPWAAYSEPGGTWLVAHDAIWRVHDARRGTPAADQIAWFAVTVGLGGECEGHVPCYVEWRNRLQGEYLRRYPSGTHAAEAVAEIGRTIAMLNGPPAARSAFTLDTQEDCRPLTASVEALRRAVDAAKGAPDREATLAGLAELVRRCGAPA